MLQRLNVYKRIERRYNMHLVNLDAARHIQTAVPTKVSASWYWERENYTMLFNATESWYFKIILYLLLNEDWKGFIFSRSLIRFWLFMVDFRCYKDVSYRVIYRIHHNQAPGLGCSRRLSKLLTASYDPSEMNRGDETP